MVYKVVITSAARRRLESFIDYTANTLHNKEAARAIRDDAKKTKDMLSIAAKSLPICSDPLLAKYEYRKIPFIRHDFVMIYRIEDNLVIVDTRL